jgi:hypothetical protein
MIKATDYKRISGYVISHPLVRFEYVALVLSEFQSFVCGMAIGLAVLPDSILEQIRQIANE